MANHRRGNHGNLFLLVGIDHHEGACEMKHGTSKIVSFGSVYLKSTVAVVLTLRKVHQSMQVELCPSCVQSPWICSGWIYTCQRRCRQSIC
jgi:hypothetical protein